MANKPKRKRARFFRGMNPDVHARFRAAGPNWRCWLDADMPELEETPSPEPASTEQVYVPRSTTTSKNARKWYADVTPKRGRRWPTPDASWFDAVAFACNRERQDHAVRLHVKQRMRDLLRNTQTARTAATALSSELPSIIAESRGHPELERLTALQSEIEWLRRDFLAPRHRPGGQRKPEIAFGCRIAAHLWMFLQQEGIVASSRPDGPLVRFCLSAVRAVFGDSATSAEGLSKAVRLHLAKLQ